MRSNLIHIANSAFNQPVLMAPGYARTFYSVLATRMGIGKLVDGITGEEFGSSEIKQEISAFTVEHEKEMEDRASDDTVVEDRPYHVINGIALIPVSGTLVHKHGYVQPVSGMTGYDSISYRLSRAVKDPGVRGALLDFDTSGGQVAGNYDVVDLISRYRQMKPIWALCDELCCSGGMSLASACSRRLITQTGVMGSVGVLSAHTDISKALDKSGTTITLIYDGAHKVDGNPYEKLPESVRDKMQAEMKKLRYAFAEKVATNIGMDVQDVLATEAAMYTGQEAVDIGFADEVVNSHDAISVFSEYLDAQETEIVDMGITMNDKDKQGSPTKPVASSNDAGKKVELPGVKPEASKVSDASVDIATAERERIMGILNSDEAKGREDMASHLANMPGMSVDAAKELLATAPVANGDSSPAAEAIAALQDEHGSPLKSDASESESSDEDAQVSALVSSFSGKKS